MRKSHCGPMQVKENQNREERSRRATLSFYQGRERRKVKEYKNNNPTLSIRSIEKEKGEGSSLKPHYMSGALHMITSFNTHNTVVGPFPPIFTHSLTRSKTTSSCSLPGTRKELVTKRQQAEILPTSYFLSNEEME